MITAHARHENKGEATLEGWGTRWRGIWDERTTYLKNEKIGKKSQEVSVFRTKDLVATFCFDKTLY